MKRARVDTDNDDGSSMRVDSCVCTRDSHNWSVDEGWKHYACSVYFCKKVKYQAREQLGSRLQTISLTPDELEPLRGTAPLTCTLYVVVTLLA